ncbi:fimbria/pilus outer membrane usher protein [Yokenella regensburgei]|uniref:fimbria/pilus outer membrane usher protein n=1 Tax=Yokenella regensburgei TaxID=158877 RepID=UPI003F176E5E
MAVLRQVIIPAMLLLVHAVSVQAQEGDDALPPPPDAQAINEDAVFHLNLVLNHYDTQQVVPVTRRAGAYFVASADLQRAGIPAEHLPQGEVNVSALANVRTDYDSAGQRLLLFMPREWLPERFTAFNGEQERSELFYGRGSLLNYDFYTSNTEQIGGQASLWHEYRFFAGNASLSTTGTWISRLSGDAAQQEGYTRYDTSLLFTNEDNATQISVGDVISDALSWSSSVRVGGISYGRDFSLRPDLVTWPIPSFSGEAAVPTSVDVFINGYRAGSRQLEPGPFTLTNLPYINGAGNAVLVTTDALGRQVSTTMPFYVASDLLKAGLHDGALTVGSLRRNYGLDNFDYGPLVGSGSYRYGLTDYLTLEAHGEGAQELALGGAGAVIKAGRLGVVNTAWTESRMREESGSQFNWGYQYSTSAFSIATQHIRRDRGFGNLALYDQNYYYASATNRSAQPVASLSRNTDQYSLSFTLGDYGTVGAAWIGVQSFDNSKTELLNLSWSKSLWGASSLYVSGSHDKQRGDWTMAMAIQIPLGERDNATFSLEKTPDYGNAQRVNYSHSMPSDGGLSWNLSLGRQSEGDSYQQGTLGWRNNNVEMQGGLYGYTGMRTWWGEVMGSLVMMDNELLAANRINDAFVVVSTGGQPDIPVNYENQPVGKTNKNGYLLISGVSSYYPATYSINTLNLPADTSIAQTERRVALRRHTGYLVEFPMEQERVANVILHDEQGDPVPVTSQVSREGKPTAVVGYDGIAWIENLEESSVLNVRLPDGSRCVARFTLDPNPEHKLQTYGPLTCRRSN